MPDKPKIDAMLSLKSEGRLLVGRDRIAVLEEVAKQGSITAAAKTLGLSYKGAWDAIIGINNLLPVPAVITQSGGKRGGGAQVTEAGLRLIASFRRLEETLAQLSQSLTAEEGNPDLLFWSVAMKTSARNALHCKVTAIQRAPVSVAVTLALSESHAITATITNDSADALALMPGQEVIALVKASFVMLAAAEVADKLSTPNRLIGTVISRSDGAVNAEIALDLGGGKTLAAVIAKSAADIMPIAVGDQLCAFFNPSHIILAAG